MLKVALLYQTREGQTGRILNVIKTQMEQSGFQATVFDVGESSGSIDLDSFDAFILGCSVRYGHHHKKFCQFVESNYQTLNARPSFFFSVNLTARKPQRSRPDNNRYLQKYLARTPWKPDLVDVFAGALLYSRYDLFSKLAIQLIMKLTGGSTDTSKDIEYTDWERVDKFCRTVADRLNNSVRQKSEPVGTIV
ncbi:menaquinone-dependent protoporphyrinogen IX dehydrogenase [Endozoicomonas gorgoniicola]|uniref:Protoporphyrinogen IX dehydrogenase [quinone] n=1 Tax=Endozoicomonas gorgoniicola TaxID=1234144 RepID=A0ABT3MR28_9GAMM|nr:menaquinone-dependent protoporphyrinogen IX dehydrogenase [Endozoicomonas gorgoniicola]MCW7551563.1 menaquinone-dependent protoporphyrinogen IX dehydrogenase [Endozoicomonas gorgoniicola]